MAKKPAPTKKARVVETSAALDPVTQDEGHPSAGPTPEDQANDPPEAFEPAPEPEPDAAAEPVAPVPSAGPTPEMQEQLAKDAEEAAKAEADAEKGAKARERKRAAAAATIEKLKADGFLVPYVETHASPEDAKNLVVVKV